jgi:hypothetical protein
MCAGGVAPGVLASIVCSGAVFFQSSAYVERTDAIAYYVELVCSCQVVAAKTR